MADQTTFSDRLKAAQKNAGMDNRALAAKVGVHSVTVSQWRSGKQSPDDGTLDSIAAALGTTKSWLRYGQAAAAEPQAAYRPDAGEEVALPRQLEIRALEFEREALHAGADAPFMRYARSRMRDPHLLAMFAGGYDEKPMSAEEQRTEFEVVIDELRSVMKRRIRRLGLVP